MIDFIYLKNLNEVPYTHKKEITAPAALEESGLLLGNEEVILTKLLSLS